MLKKFSFLYILCILTFPNHANAVKTKKAPAAPSPVQATLVVDTKTGKILHEQNSKTLVYPASLTKLMTLYLMFEGLESGKLSMNQKLLVSEKASKMPPCKLGLKPGEYITVRDAVLGLITQSANDAAVTVAEGMAGSEVNFAKLMTTRARELGMKDTSFSNASGWHHPEQKTTARDLAKLSIALKEHYAKYYPLFSRTSFVFKGQTIRGHNHVVAKYEGAEGLKTGYHRHSGFNLITTASKNNKSLVAVVTGGRTIASRDQKMVSLLDTHFGSTPVKAKAPLKKTMKVASATTKLSKRKVSRG